MRKRNARGTKLEQDRGKRRGSPKVIMVVNIDRNILVFQRNMERVLLSPEWLGRVVY